MRQISIKSRWRSHKLWLACTPWHRRFAPLLNKLRKKRAQKGQSPLVRALSSIYKGTTVLPENPCLYEAKYSTAIHIIQGH